MAQKKATNLKSLNNQEGKQQENNKLDKKKKSPFQVSLQLLLNVAFISQMIVLVMIIGILSYSSGKSAVDDLTTQLTREIASRIEQKTSAYLQDPQIVLHSMAAQIKNGFLSINDPDKIRDYFFKLIHLSDSVPYIYLSDIHGNFFGVERTDDGKCDYKYRNQKTAPLRYIYELSKDNKIGKLIKKQNYEPRTRPWFVQSQKTGRMIWTDIYPNASRRELIVSAAIPAYKNGYWGSISINVSLKKINQFLQSLKISKTGQAFIVEPSGYIVAISSGEDPFLSKGKNQEIKHITLSSNALIKSAVAKLIQKDKEIFNKIPKKTSMTMDLDGEAVRVLLNPIKDDFGLRWVIAVLMPEADFMGKITTNTKRTLMLAIIAIIISIIITIFVSRWLNKPLLLLGHVSQNIANGKWEENVPDFTIREISHLGKDFTSMTHQLQKSFHILELKNLELENLLGATNRFVPKAFLNHLDKKSIVEVTLGDCVQKNMSILFSDIRSFTNLSEKMSIDDNFNFINSYLAKMVPVIQANNGFVDKYIGDAIMALFDHSVRDAVDAAVAMQIEMRNYNIKRQAQGYPAVQIGIGINTGMLMLGTVGERERMETTVISDAVNIASRVEGMTKLYGVKIVITENTFAGLTDKKGIYLRYLDEVAAKGKEKSIKIFEVFSGDEERVIEKKKEIAADYRLAIGAYRRKNFSAALNYFQRALEIFPEDQVCKIYQDRCEKFLLSPDNISDIDMVNRLNTK